VDAQMREEVAASVAAHRHLGGEYDAELAEDLVKRIGAEIDTRVDARLAQPGHHATASRSVGPSLVMGLGSIGLGVGATGAVLSAGTSITTTGIVAHAASSGQLGLDALIWIVIGAVNVAYARRR
jgi:hypothetical protein